LVKEGWQSRGGLFQNIEHLMRAQSVYDDMSEAERMVAAYINQLGFWWTYEQPVYVTAEKDRPRIFCPDFYIADVGVYVEVIGNKYLSDYNRRQEIYLRNQIPIIFIEVNRYNWQDELRAEIYNIHQQRWEKILRMNARYTM
jgi:hypothetical protein